jgi:hypothetical protein
MYSPDDERYTIEYIQREANLLVNYLKKGARHHAFVKTAYRLSQRDVTILKRWGLL